MTDKTAPSAPGKPRTGKGEQTRARILDSALDLFRERGYDQTTMRAAAQRAGVSVGNAYYYFESKEHLIQAFYAQSLAEHVAVAEPRLESERSLQARLEAVLRARIETSEPHHPFAGALFKTAADPKSPLSPFSPESEPVRTQATALLNRVVEGSRTKVPADLAAELPGLLWLYSMGIVLFWIHDESPGRRRTYRLVERTSELVARLIQLASNPLLRPLRRTTLRLIAELRDEAAA